MAEAHQAVSYSNLVKHDHQTSARHENEYLQQSHRLKSKSWKKRCGQINRKIRNAIYPVHVESFWIISIMVMSFHFATEKNPFDLVNFVFGQLQR